MPRRTGPSPRFYSTHDSAKMLGVSSATIVNWVRAGHLAAHRTPGGHRRIREAELVAFAAARGLVLDVSGCEEPLPCVRLLLVDDDADFAELVGSYLERKHGWVVDVVTSGFAAGLAVARTSPAAVLLDLQLPGFDGFAVAAELSADPNLRNVPILAMSGHAHLLAEARTRSTFFATLRKPIDLFELSSRLETVVGPSKGERRVLGPA